MKKLILATALGALISPPAFAADMAAHMPMKAPMMAAPVTSWQGLYIGGNVGYGWGNGASGFSFLPDPVAFNVQNASLATKSNGVIGGAQIGYNWQMGSLVTGFETDFQGSGIKGSAGPIGAFFTDTGLPAVPSAMSANPKLSWFGTLRGRLGVLTSSDLLLYATGGLAYGKIDGNGIATIDVTSVGNFNQVKAGWTAGAGAEWMFAHNWSAKAEYLYVDLGSASVLGQGGFTPPFGVRFSWKAQENIVRAGVNYHF